MKDQWEDEAGSNNDERQYLDNKKFNIRYNYHFRSAADISPYPNILLTINCLDTDESTISPSVVPSNSQVVPYTNIPQAKVNPDLSKHSDNFSQQILQKNWSIFFSKAEF